MIDLANRGFDVPSLLCLIYDLQVEQLEHILLSMRWQLEIEMKKFIDWKVCFL